MPKADMDETHKHTLHLFKGDYERLRELVPGTPPAILIRHIVRAYINKLSPPLNKKIEVKEL